MAPEFIVNLAAIRYYPVFPEYPDRVIPGNPFE
jgi:hypothetical protein